MNQQNIDMLNKIIERQKKIEDKLTKVGRIRLEQNIRKLTELKNKKEK